MKRDLKYKIMVPIFGGYFLALAVWAISAFAAGTITFSMVVIGLISILVLGFMSSFITARMLKSPAAPEVRRQLASFVENVSAVMKEIENSGKEIDNITNIINDIRFQAHLLALNATIEAARAGEAGRGFAVIAAEIKNLAQKTAESSKTLGALVTQNMTSAKKGLELIDEIPGPV